MTKRRERLRGDDGVTLLLALIVVTVVALVTAALVQQSFTNTATTITVRQVAATQYAADAAAQYATNQLRLSDLSSGLCSSSTTVTSEDLANFYPKGPSTVAQNAHIDCAPDSGNGSGGVGGTSTTCPAPPTPCPNAAPGTALLTLDNNVGEPGIYVNDQAGSPLKIRGGIFSNSKIIVTGSGGSLQNSWCPSNPPGSTTYVCSQTKPTTYIIAKGSCSGTLSFLQSGATSQCDYTTANDARGADPGVARPRYTPGASYNTPPPPTGLARSQSCTSVPANPASPGTACTADTNPAAGCGTRKFQQVLPGRIGGPTAAERTAGINFLNGLTGCSNGIIQFTPGTYYFDLGTQWNPASKTVIVGGTFASGYDPVAGSGPGGWPTSCSGTSCTADYQDACVPPGSPAATTSTGVEFVIGGGTQFNINNSSGFGSHVTLCSSNSPDGPPIVMYGLKSGIGSGSTAVSASNLCTPTGGSTTCALITSNNSPKTTINLVGMTYTTRSVIHIGLNNSSSKLFYWGVISWAIEFDTTGGASLGSALIDVQDGWPSEGVTVNRYYLNVYACDVTAGSCPAAGAKPNVRAVVQVGSDTSGNPLPAGNILVLGWSVKR